MDQAKRAVMPGECSGTTSMRTTDSASGDDVLGERGVFKVGVRIPPFWPEEAALWFAQMEGQFVLSGITADSTKFYYVISQLENKYAIEVKDIINSPPSVNKYEKLKTELIRRLSASQEKKVQQLLMHEELGDRKPSQFLRHLRTLAGPTVPDSFICTLWSSRLPQNIQTVIASQINLPLESVAELADRVHEIAPPGPAVAAAAWPDTSNSLSELAKQMAELTREFAAFKGQVHSLSHRHNGRSADRKPTPYRGRSRSRSKPRDNGHCWYHNRFGNRATRCTTPCTFSENTNGSRN